ncbi:MAG: hypothetical protein AB7I18_06245 [Candidatus Berkiella sp.]
MKKILYFFLGCAIIGFIASLILSTLPAFEMAGGAILRALKEGSYEQAYAMFSPDLKERFPIQNVIQFSNQYDLKNFKEVKWLKNETNANKTSGYIVGEMKIGDGSLPIELQFVKIKSNTFYGSTWYVDDVFVGRDVIRRQTEAFSKKDKPDSPIRIQIEPPPEPGR